MKAIGRVRFIWISLLVGIVFGLVDGVIHANPMAEKMYEAYQPLVRDSINMLAGILIDLVYGFILCGSYLWLRSILPGRSDFAKGVVFGMFIWVFRVMMYAISQWMMFEIPLLTIFYVMIAGFFEMIILGGFIGLLIKRKQK